MAEGSAWKFVMLLVLLAVFAASCSPSESDVRNKYNEKTCYKTSDIQVTGGGIVVNGPSGKCGDTEAIGDIWLYAVRYASGDEFKDTAKNELLDRIGSDCEKLPDSLWGNKWKKISEGVINYPGGDNIYAIICAWTEGNTDLSNTISGDVYQSRIGSIKADDPGVSGFSLEGLGAGCSGYANGWYYAGRYGGTPGIRGLCVKYYTENGAYNACDENGTNCVNIDYNVGVPQHTCNNDQVCDSPWEDESNCGDCRVDCTARAADLPSGKVGYEQLISSNKDDVLACQGDLVGPGYISRSYMCKMCPKTNAHEPYLPGREWLSTSWAWPYETPEGSYSTTSDDTAWGCVNVEEGSPFNCGVCGFADMPTEDTVTDTLPYLTPGYCSAYVGSNNVFCVEETKGDLQFKCEPPEVARGDSSASPWFSKYPNANPTYFYTVAAEGSGWKSVSPGIVCSDSSSSSSSSSSGGGTGGGGGQGGKTA